MKKQKKKHPGGRPREHDREQIAIDMIKWAEKYDSINLCKFCALYEPKIPPYKLSIWAKEDEEFRKAHEIAKAFLGFRREEWLNTEKLHVKGYDLNAQTYDFFLKEEKRQQAEFESSLKSQEQIAVSEHDNKRFDDLMQQIKELQSDRSIASSSISDAQ